MAEDPATSGPAQYLATITGTGYDGDFVSTQAEGEGNPAVNSAAWSGRLAGGTYDVQVFIPYSSRAVANTAYYVNYDGGTTKVYVNQNNFRNQWADLGTYVIHGTASVTSNDSTGTRYAYIGWDAVQWVQLDSAAPPPAPQGGMVEDPTLAGPPQYLVHFSAPNLGEDGDMVRTQAVGAGAPAENSATWSMKLAPGVYTVSAFIPNQHSVANTDYTVYRDGGSEVHYVNQSLYFNQWVTLATVTITSGGGTVTSNDSTSYYGAEIGWDAMQWAWVGPAPSPPQPPPGPPAYVALGDSYSSGEGAPYNNLFSDPWDPGTGSNGDGCHRSSQSYPGQVNSIAANGSSGRVVNMQMYFYACSGDEIGGVEFGQVINNNKLPSTASLVTVTAGGNDIKFDEIGRQCAFTVNLPWPFTTCKDYYNRTGQDELKHRIDDMAKNLPGLYKQLRNRFGPAASVWVLTYPNLLGNNLAPWCTGNLNATDRDYLKGIIAYLDAAIANQAALAGVHLLDEYHAFDGTNTGGVSHLLCDGDSWVTPITTENPLSSTEAFHPTSNGYHQEAWELVNAGALSFPLNPQPSSTGPSYTVPPGNTITPLVARPLSPMQNGITASQPVTVSAGGFVPGSTVQVQMGSVSLTPAVAGADGTASTVERVPVGTAVGSHQVTMSGTADKGGTLTAMASVYVLGGDFHPLTASRIVDTRNGTGGLSGPLPAGRSTFQVTGQGGVPSSGVSSVYVNLTATGANAAGFLTAYSSARSVPGTSNLNFAAGQTVAALADVPVGADGRIAVVNNINDGVQLIIDVEGWHGDGTDTGGSRFAGVFPTRIVDSRSGQGGVSQLGPQTGASFNVLGVGGVPASGVTAVMLDVTALGQSSGFMTFYPGGTGIPQTSALNYSAGQNVTNSVVVPVGSNGTVGVWNSSGTAQVLVDVEGWYGAAPAQGVHHMTSPLRIVDTRDGTGGIAPLQPWTATPITVAGTAGVPRGGVGGVVLDVTVTSPSAAGWVMAYPTGGPQAGTTSVSFGAGQTFSGMIVTPVGPTGQVNLYLGSTGSAQVIVDVEGWYDGPQSGATANAFTINSLPQVEDFLVGTDSTAYHQWCCWTGFYSMTGVSLRPGLVVMPNADGRMEVFGIGTDAQMYHIWQGSFGGGWASWSPMGGSWPGRPAVVRNADGRLEIFARGNDANIYHMWQTCPGCGWTPGWASLGGTFHRDPVAILNGSGQVNVFVPGDDGALWESGQQTSGTWTSWASLGGSLPGAPAIARNADGRLEAFARGSDGTLNHASETCPGCAWSSWSGLPGIALQGDPAAAANADGRLEVFGVVSGGSLYHIAQTAPGANWSSWSTLGGNLRGAPQAITNTLSRIEVFALGAADSALYHVWQNTPGGPSWSGVYSLGGVWPSM